MNGLQFQGLDRDRTCTTPNTSPDELTVLQPDAEAFAHLAARSADPVLLHGETGCGKTCLARLVHALGPSPRPPFVHVNCAGIPEALFEREMFGHVRGAFTDAHETRPGLLEAAHGGTLFLDEIGELPLSVQPKLLQALEEGTIRRLGSTHAHPARFRLISATNRDLEQMLGEHRFREDLYYRCAVLEFRLPPLRERGREIPQLVDRFLARRPEGARAEVGPGALEVLRAYAWPGNLRELDNCLRHALAYAAGGTIEPDHLPERVRAGRRTAAAPSPVPAMRIYVAPADADEEVRMIRDALQAEGGNKTRAARRLGMSRGTLWIKLQRHGLAFLAAE